MSFFITSIIMFCFWILLSGYFDFFHIFLGVMCSLFVAFVSHDLLIGAGADIRRGFKGLWRFVRYVPWFLFEVFKANVDVAYMTLHPKMPINPKIIKVKTDLKTELAIVTFANSVTLTPGTVTVEAGGDGEFIVHAIADKPAETLLQGEMARRVKRIEDV